MNKAQMQQRIERLEAALETIYERGYEDGFEQGFEDAGKEMQKNQIIKNPNGQFYLTQPNYTSNNTRFTLHNITP